MSEAGMTNLVISPSTRLQGHVTLPGDKSISHRALIFGAMAQGTTVARNWLQAGVTARMVDTLTAMGIPINIEPTGPGQATLTVNGKGLAGFYPPSAPLFCGGSATTMRLLMGLLATQSFSATLDGHAGLRRRPMERIAAPLREMGASITTTDGHAPLTLSGGGLKAIEYQMPVASAQLQTALLIAALGAKGQMVLHQPGPARDHTVRLLNSQGADIQDENGVITFNPAAFILQALNFTIPGDMSAAAFLIVAALTTANSHLTLQGVNLNPTRTGLLDTLQAMHGDIAIESEKVQAGEPIGDVVVQSSSLTAATVTGNVVVRMIDEFPIFTVAALQAKGVTLVRDAAELRLKESDRIDVVVEEFGKLGAEIRPHPDGFEIHGPQQLRGGMVNSRRDHRIAMALAVAGLSADGETIIEGADELHESFPGFVETLQNLGAGIAWDTPTHHDFPKKL
jgi:3-phosphoshikimate 1-carboxyvinyltransferase